MVALVVVDDSSLAQFSEDPLVFWTGLHDVIHVKGRESPVEIFEVTDLNS
jgi:hypothetical protein